MALRESTFVATEHSPTSRMQPPSSWRSQHQSMLPHLLVFTHDEHATLCASDVRAAGYYCALIVISLAMPRT
eukprot:scaffold29259_cov24-Tisochrysis_lutea.AAC.2